MPRPRKTDSQRRAERFKELYRIGKARIGATDEQIADCVGVHRTTISKRMKNPGKYFTYDDLARLCEEFRWTDEDILSLFRVEKR